MNITASIDEYINDYDNFIYCKGEANKFHIQATKIWQNYDLSTVLYYKSTKKTAKVKNNRVFLLVSSIFNSPEILFVSKKQNFIDNLLQYGDVYLVKWNNPEKQYKINDYVLSLSTIIKKLKTQNVTKKIDLVGHCIGGNLAVAITILKQQYIRSLTMLTSPWDYSHFLLAIKLYKMFGFYDLIKETELVPKIYIQIMFFLMFPNQFQQKIVNYETRTKFEKENYLLVEKWLQSGTNLAKATYDEIITNLVEHNMLLNNEWYINDKQIDPSKISVPVCIITSKKDKIAPKNSILPLHKSLKNSTLIEIAGGHISYLLKDNQNFNNNYKKWLTTI